jgi:hypothetical protein
MTCAESSTRPTGGLPGAPPVREDPAVIRPSQHSESASRATLRHRALIAFGLLLLLAGSVTPRAGHTAERDPLRVFVTEPFLDLRTGPAEGYPVTQVAVRGEAVDTLFQRGEFVRLRTERGVEAWARASDLNRGRLGDGSLPRFPERVREEFPDRRWEAGPMAGEFGGTKLAAVYGAVRLAPGLQLELAGANVLGSSRSLYLVEAGLNYAPLRGARLEPFVMAGYGLAQETEGLPVLGSTDRSDRTAYAGVGLRATLTGPLFLRVDLRRRFVYANGAETEEINEWRIGIGFFP